ncbi:UPF0412 protein yaaI Flags: Precursor [Salmonella enterica subsp. enterica]|nr:UPF0412 protein yaaI Flags: Precursor [Salmonella enterica subsp. enterica]
MLIEPVKEKFHAICVNHFRRPAFGLALSSVAHANDHKILGVIAMPRNETNDLTLKIPVCRIVKRIQLTADHGDIELSGASVYFKTARSASQSLNVPSSIKEGQTTGWININSDNDNKRCVSKITFSGHTVNSSDMARLKVIGDD